MKLPDHTELSEGISRHWESLFERLNTARQAVATGQPPVQISGELVRLGWHDHEGQGVSAGYRAAVSGYGAQRYPG